MHVKARVAFGLSPMLSSLALWCCPRLFQLLHYIRHVVAEHDATRRLIYSLCPTHVNGRQRFSSPCCRLAKLTLISLELAISNEVGPRSVVLQDVHPGE